MDLRETSCQGALSPWEMQRAVREIFADGAGAADGEVKRDAGIVRSGAGIDQSRQARFARKRRSNLGVNLGVANLEVKGETSVSTGEIARDAGDRIHAFKGRRRRCGLAATTITGRLRDTSRSYCLGNRSRSTSDRGRARLFPRRARRSSRCMKLRRRPLSSQIFRKTNQFLR